MSDGCNLRRPLRKMRVSPRVSKKSVQSSRVDEGVAGASCSRGAVQAYDCKKAIRHHFGSPRLESTLYRE